MQEKEKETGERLNISPRGGQERGRKSLSRKEKKVAKGRARRRGGKGFGRLREKGK